MQRSTVMEFCINVCLLLYLENGFRGPSTCEDVMLATELAQRRPKCPADYKQIARVLSPIFSEEQKPVVLSGQACRERMNGLISKYLEEDKDFTYNSC